MEESNNILIKAANFYLENGDSAIFLLEKIINIEVSKVLKGFFVSKNLKGDIMYRRVKLSSENKTYKTIWLIGENDRKVMLPLKKF